MTITHIAYGTAKWVRDFELTQTQLDEMIKDFCQNFIHEEDRENFPSIDIKVFAQWVAQGTDEEVWKKEYECTTQDHTYVWKATFADYCNDAIHDRIYSEYPEFVDWDEDDSELRVDGRNVCGDIF